MPWHSPRRACCHQWGRHEALSLGAVAGCHPRSRQLHGPKHGPALSASLCWAFAGWACTQVQVYTAQPWGCTHTLRHTPIPFPLSFTIPEPSSVRRSKATTSQPLGQPLTVKQEIPNVGKDVEKLEPSYVCWCGCKMAISFVKQSGSSLKSYHITQKSHLEVHTQKKWK